MRPSRETKRAVAGRREVGDATRGSSRRTRANAGETGRVTAGDATFVAAGQRDDGDERRAVAAVAERRA